MHKRPENFNVEIFVGCKLEQICFSAHQLVLRFCDAVSVTVLSSYLIHKGADEIATKAIPASATYSNLMIFLERVVIGAICTEEGTISLTFEGGNMITIKNDSTAYESYIIHYNGVDIVV